MAEYFEREALIGDLTAAMDHRGMGQVIGQTLIRYVKRQPAADVVPVVHGRWIEDHDYLKCPECGVMVKWDFTFFDIGNWNYCPNCGAKMDGGADCAAD